MCVSCGGHEFWNGTAMSVTISPATASVAIGKTQQFTATVNHDTGTSHVATWGTWSSSNPAVASVDAVGVGSGIKAGTAVISMATEDVTGSATVTVTLSALNAIHVTPQNPSIAVQTTLQFAATGTYDSGVGADITPDWQLVAPNGKPERHPVRSESHGCRAGLGKGRLRCHATP
jgi:hypothetical protein